MAGYLITGGNEVSKWSAVEQYSGCSRTELERNGYGLILSKEKKEYTVSDLEPLEQFSADAMRHDKYCVIPDAECLSVITQNKLLKSLEDSNITFLLLAITDSTLLPTVKSRLIHIRLGNYNEADRVYDTFIGLKSRRELFSRLHMDEDNDEEHAYYSMNVPSFISEVENLFLLLIGYLSWGECEKKEALLKDLSQLWKNTETAVKACDICEKHRKKSNYTKDDLFLLVAELAEIGE